MQERKYWDYYTQIGDQFDKFVDSETQLTNSALGHTAAINFSNEMGFEQKNNPTLNAHDRKKNPKKNGNSAYKKKQKKETLGRVIVLRLFCF